MDQSKARPAKPRSKRPGPNPKAPAAQQAHKRKPTRAAVQPDSNGSNSLVRMLGLFDLFTPAAPAWSSDALIRSLGVSRSTGYRYIKALADVGLLAPVLSGHYILGPRIIELDLQIRQCDPLYNAAGPAMKKLVRDSGHSAVVCALFSSSVLCVREELTPERPSHLFTRGHKRPLFRGALSKAILAYLRPHQLRSVFARHHDTIATSDLGSDWDSFKANLAKIRAAGVVTTLGEFNPGVIGIAAPIFNRSGQILGSIGIAGAESKFDRAEIERIGALVKKAAEEVSERINVLGMGTDRPARAVG